MPRELLESRIPSLKYLYEITFKIKGAKSIKSKDTSTTTVKESTTKDSDEDNFSLINPETYKEPSQTSSDASPGKSKVSQPKKTTHEKESTARHIVTSHSRQQSIFNNKIKSEQTRLTEELNQLQVHVQSLKHNMQSDKIRQEFELLIKKDVATLKESLLETFENKFKKLQKEIDTPKNENSELWIHIDNIKQRKDISDNQDKENNIPAGTRRPEDVPRRSPKGPNVRDPGRPSGDSQGTNTKIDDLMKKLFFRCNSPCFTHLFLFFTEKTNIQMF